MKKFLFIFTMLLSTSVYASAEGHDGQIVVTDCGTSHAIDSDSSVDEAIESLDYYTEQDC